MLSEQPKYRFFVYAIVSVLMVTFAFCLTFLSAYAQVADDRVETFAARAKELLAQDKHAEALPFAEEALAAAERKFGPQHEMVAKHLGRLGAIYYFLKRPEDVIRVIGRYYDIIEPLVIQKKQPPFDPISDVCLVILSQAHLSLGRADLQARFLNRWIATSEQALGYDHPYLAGLVEQLADIEEGLGHTDNAVPLKQRASDIAIGALRSNHPGLAPDHQPTGTPGMVSKGDLLQMLFMRAQSDVAKGGDAAEAARLLEFIIQFRETLRGPKEADANFAMPLWELFQLGQLYQKMGRNDQAIETYKKVIARGELLKAENPDNNAVLVLLRGAYVILNDMLPNPPDLPDSHFAGNELALADYYSSLAIDLEIKKQYDKAEEKRKRVVSIREKVLGPDSPELAQTLIRFGILYSEMGRESDAKALYDRGKTIKQASDRIVKETDVGNLLNRWNDLQHLRGKFETLHWSTMQHAVEQTKDYGPSHPFTQLALRGVSQQSLTRKHWRNAVIVLNRIQAGVVETLRHQQADSDGASAGQGKGNITGFKFDAWGEHIFEQLIWASHELAREEPGRGMDLQKDTFVSAQLAHNSLAATALAQMSARTAAGSGELAKLARERQDLVAEWQKLDAWRNTAIGRAPDKRDAKAEAENTAGLNAIDARVAETDKRLAAEFPEYAAFASPAPLAAEDVQAQLGPGEALVLFFDTDDRFEAVPPGETFIWVVTKTDVRWVRSDLGTAALTAEVQALRCGLDEEEWATPTKAHHCGDLLGLTELPDPARPLPFHLGRAHALYRALFGQIEDMIAGKRLLIVPSGPLTSLPFHVLVTKQPQTDLPSTFEAYRDVAWLGRSNAIATLPAVSSLKALRQHARNGQTASSDYIGYGDPVLNGDGTTCRTPKVPSVCPAVDVAHQPVTTTAAVPSERATIRGRGGRRSAHATTDDVFAKGATPETVLENVRSLCPLPDTAYEIKCVSEHFKEDSRLIRLEADAKEADIKALSKDGKLTRYRILHFATHGLLSGDVEKMVQRQGEPALVLTPPAKSDPADASDDGLLMASEIAALHLNADWVVLSACNTAAGDQPGGQALSGLARAFFYAGGRALVVSHWPVYSDAAVRLTTRAFAELDRDPKAGRAEALQRAMTELMDDRSQADNAHPAVWAPFVVVGEGGR